MAFTVLRLPSWAILAAFVATASQVQAQTAVDRLEERLRAAEAAAEELPVPEAAAAEPGYLGAVTDDRQDRGRGVRIVEAVADGPAASAGLVDGDLIVEVAGQPVRRMADLAAAIQAAAAGDRLSIGVLRDGVRQLVDVTLGRRPPPDERRFDEFGRVPEVGDAPGPAAGRVVAGDDPGPPHLRAADEAGPPGPRLGIAARGVSAETRRLLDLPNTRGALVTEVVVGSPADRAGIPLQAMIVSVGGLVVRNPNELGEALSLLEPGKDVEIAYYRGPTLHKVTVRMGELELPAADPRPPAGERPAAEADAPGSGEPDDRVRALELRVEELERRIEELERRLQESEA